MSDAPLVSTIIPVYNRTYCVMDAVQSVFEQTHPNLECVVVDDGSTDDSLAVVAAAAAGEPRLRVVTQENAGVSSARNHGVRVARGEFVTFLDSDDLMPPYRISHGLALLAEKECDAVIGQCEIFSIGGAPLPTWQAQKGSYFTSVLLLPQHLRDVGGFDETLQVGEDLDLMVKLQAHGFIIFTTDETFAIRRYHGDNLTYVLTQDEVDKAVLGAARRHLARRRAAASE